MSAFVAQDEISLDTIDDTSVRLNLQLMEHSLDPDNDLLDEKHALEISQQYRTE